MQESRQHIRARMLKNAAKAWGYGEVESENSFDPVVAMLLAACSTEIEKISHEIHSSRARILERLVGLLSPDVLTGPMPTHGIGSALPIEERTELSADTQFFTHRRMSSHPENEETGKKEIFFSPTGSFPLVKASIRFIATGDLLYKISHTISKEIIARSDEETRLPASTLWLGIDGPGVSLHDSLFYFDFHNEADKQLFYHQLPKASWSIGNHKLGHLPGYGNRQISGETIDLETNISRDDGVTLKIKRQANAFYKSHFVTLLDSDGISAKQEYSIVAPEIIKNAFSGKNVEWVLQQPIRWICVQFPETISNIKLQELGCAINCFPVLNRRLYQMNSRLQEIVNILPLQTEEVFLDLEAISTDDGREIKVRSVDNNQDESLSMLMRNGGVGRFDERDAVAIIDNILQLLRDENAAFSALGNDFMNNEIRQLQQVMNRLEQRLQATKLKHAQTPYVIIRNDEKKALSNLMIRYWSTDGLEGNGIRSGSILNLYAGAALYGNQAILVTTTTGGRNKLSTTESILAYKAALLSKERIVSIEDIKSFCHYQLGERVKNIEVRKGIMTHPDSKQGYLKCLDVAITINKKVFKEMQDKGEIVFWRDNLTLLLDEKSSTMMPFRISILPAD